MTYAEDLDTFAAAVRAAEHGADVKQNYLDASTVLTQRRARLLGAYRIPSDQWVQMAEAAGLSGADWRSPAAQDRVAKNTFDRLYRRYQDWGMVALAWKAGEDVADRVASSEVGLAGELPGPTGRQLGKYVARVAGTLPAAPTSPVDVNESPPMVAQAANVNQAQKRNRVDTALLSALKAMRSQVQANPREATPEAETTEESQS